MKHVVGVGVRIVLARRSRVALVLKYVIRVRYERILTRYECGRYGHFRALKQRGCGSLSERRAETRALN
jgi:hypothetical protein